ncbi:MAG: tryptophan synthase subunit alpha [Bacillota bacterium]
MSRIAARFAELKERGEKGLVAYVAAGDPNLEASRQIIHGLVAGGVDLIELGLPFSDPLADGPVIQAGTQRALAAGANTDNVLELIATVRQEGVTLPILIMTYYNLLNRPGVAAFCRRAREAGVDGLIIPDVPMEEGDELLDATRVHGLDLVQFVAPTSTPDRIERAAKLASGFVYVVSLTGVTGARESLPERMVGLVEAVKASTETPVAVGFGISKPEHVRQVTAVADAAIVGSAFVRLCGEALPAAELAERVMLLAKELKAATKAKKQG